MGHNSITLNPFPRKMQDRLNQQTVALRKRSLCRRKGIDLSSNDYLGFSQDPILTERLYKKHHETYDEKYNRPPLGATGSRLLRGNLNIHEETETYLAQFCNRESTLLFPSGYQANLGLLSAILGPGDQVFSDELNHASLIDGIRLSRAEKFIYPHKNINELTQLLEKQNNKNGLTVIVTESLFSMDGDQAPLVELVTLARQFQALLVVDESHATGLWPQPTDAESNSDQNIPARNTPTGGGLVQALGLSNSVFATVHTGGKSLGCSGAWIACDAPLKDYLINFSRPFIFSTAPSPFLALSLLEACKYWLEVGPQRAATVHAFSTSLRKQLIALQKDFLNKFFIPPGAGPIIPVILMDNELALAASAFLQNAGYDVRAIRPPTVPEGKARLRITTNYSTWTAGFDQNHFIEVLRQFLQCRKFIQSGEILPSALTQDTSVKYE